ncbi:hypothetical protein GAB14E_1098 [Colwellia psychrerythraea]|uniref:Uncharacterized protein n=2 Tax=Colwellia psychrerythraea TaxID=28229 RepID=A0A099L3I0_COLPS|nr:hypothetical protein GAB14E_1098 [Colwellia psychrerythraea]
MLRKTFTFFILLLLSISVLAMPRITVKHQRNINGFAEVQVSNATMKNLICHVAIDGHKILFRLKAIEASKWYTATDIRFNHTHFSVWCDYLKLHPQYQKP